MGDFLSTIRANTIPPGTSALGASHSTPTRTSASSHSSAGTGSHAGTPTLSSRHHDHLLFPVRHHSAARWSLCRYKFTIFKPLYCLSHRTRCTRHNRNTGHIQSLKSVRPHMPSENRFHLFFSHDLTRLNTRTSCGIDIRILDCLKLESLRVNDHEKLTSAKTRGDRRVQSIPLCCHGYFHVDHLSPQVSQKARISRALPPSSRVSSETLSRH